MQFSWPRFWVDHSRGFTYNLTWQERRNLVLSSVERAGFGWWIVLVAGIGFLTDAYDIFSINTIVPALSTIYWDGDFPLRYRLGINAATLLGSMIGQVIFGILADRYGRRKMYGLELIVVIGASLGFATASSGVNNSMSLIGLLIFWRLVVGCGIGADYPLSAVITAEFAPTRYRARMLAAVFFTQSVGQLIAVLSAFAATAGFRSRLQSPSTVNAASYCSINATDAAGIECARTLDRSWRLVAGLGSVPAAIALLFRLTIPESVYYNLDIQNDSNEAMHAKDYFDSRRDLGADESNPIEMNVVDRPSKGESNADSGELVVDNVPIDGHIPGLPQIHKSESNVQDRWDESPNRNGMMAEPEDPHPVQASRAEFHQYMIKERNWTDLFATSANWMMLDFTFYLLGVNSSRFIPTLFGHNWGSDHRDDPYVSPYRILIGTERDIMESSSIGSILGSAAAIAVMDYYSRRKIQTWGFLTLGVLFIIVGALYITLPTTNAHAAVVVLYGICQLFYNLGPNTTTFIIPAEAFPTRYRCTCYGISAAFGKLGSVLGQILVTKVTSHRRLGLTLILFVIVMLVGAASSRYLTPETTDRNGKSRTLEDLGKGKKHRKAMEQAERDVETRPERN